MFNAVRKLFGKRVENTVEETQEQYPAEATTEYTETPAPAVHHAPPRAGRVEVRRVVNPPTSSAAPATVSIPLKSILARLPADLMQRVRQMDVGEAEIFLPTAKVLSQIGSGSAKISFGELRQLAPPGTFSPENDRDRTLIDLPLHEILSRLGSGVLSRRPSQRQIEVPPEVTGPFGGQTKVTFSTTVLKKPAAAQPIPAPASMAPMAPVRPTAPVQAPVPAPSAPRFQPAIAMARPGQSAGAVQPVIARVRATLASQQPAAPVQPAVPMQAAPVAVHSAPAVEEFTFKRAFPAPAPAPKQPVFTPIAPAPEVAPAPAPIPLSESFRVNDPVAPITPIAPVPRAEPEPIRFSTPAPAPMPMPVVSGETKFLSISISEVCEAWPESIRSEISADNLQFSLVGLPFGAVEGNIKQGKIAFPWKAVRSWIKPPLPIALSENDTILVEFPLKVVTPLFLAELRSSRTQKKIAVDVNIPNLFSDARMNDVLAAAATPAPAPVPQFIPPPPVAPVAAPQPVTPVTTAARTPDTNYFAWKGAVETPAEEPQVFVKKGPSPGTAFLKRYATPNDIVTKAGELEGVDGALIALPDGLLVASRIPPTMNADTIAAFLPQIFGRVSQCTRELRLGDLNNLNFTVGNIPWKIFRVGAIFFAAFGRPGEPLPSAQLASIAAELDRKAT